MSHVALSALRRSIVSRAASVASLLVALVAAGGSRPASADDVFTDGSEPIAVIASAGIDRLLEDINYVFEAADRPQVAQFITGVAENINNFEGLDRSAPIGLYLYPRENAPNDDPEEPAGVLFVPVTDVDRLIETLRISNQVFLEKSDEPGIVELHTPEQVFDMQFVHGHLFLNFESLPLTKYPDPRALIGDNAEHYDLYVDFRKAGLRPEFIDRVVKQIMDQVESDLVQRPSESEAEYAIRRQATEVFRDVAVELIRSGEHIVAGISLGDEHGGLSIDWELRLNPESWLLDSIQASSLTTSRFASQLAQPEPATFSLALQFPAELREILLSAVQIGREEALNNADDEGGRHVVEQLFKTIQATAEAGKLDLFGQMIGQPPERIVFVGGLAIAGDDVLAQTLAEVLPHAANARQVRELNMNVGRAGDVAIHRVVPAEMRPQERRLYGEDAAFYFGVGDGAVWLAVGEEHALEVLTDVITNRSAGVASSEGEPHLRFSLHLSDWVVLGDSLGDGGEDQRRFFEAAREAFSTPDDDLMEFEVRPSEQGLRVRLHFDEGYIRLFGIAVADNIGR